MSLVSPVDGNEVGRQGLDLARIAQPTRIDTARTGDGRYELADHRNGVAVLAKDEHVWKKGMTPKEFRRQGEARFGVRTLS